MSLRSLEDRLTNLRVQVRDMHAERLALAEGCGDQTKAAEYHAQVRTLAWVLARMDDADRAGPGVVA